ncbi:hypothetical protein [Syntrophomonas wolfei]|jgi:hypothetical protein|uniref:Uncharacterized protein n=1 Tax=Syntrophomonas wolfei TaxID=863 RepID=A0A354YZ15_9FIRM|nr:hypothetical protein [Syntrophomonas wolfei]HBK53956.1 hypothetical protein [Syntrophomonas wolfei]
MNNYSPVKNCYRAILSLVNHLDDSCNDKNAMRQIYEELSELAFYIMIDDRERMIRGIEQLQHTIRELRCQENTMEYNRFQFITGEINTHLNYLLIDYCTRPKIV